MKFEWEKLAESPMHVTARAKVFNGWIVINNSCLEETNPAMSESMVFIYDPNHEWKID